MKLKLITKTLILIYFLAFSSSSMAYNISMERLFLSDSYNYLYDNYSKNSFIDKNHTDFSNLRLSQKESILIRRIEDICEDIYHGRNDFIYNPIEAKKCFYLHILQMSPRSAMKLVNISVSEKNFEDAAFYYGVFKSISENDNNGARNFILNNLNKEDFYINLEKGLDFLMNNRLIDNKNTFNPDNFLAFNYIENYTDEAIDYLIDDDISGFVSKMRERVTSGNQILLLAQSSNANRISEFCFQQSDLPLAFNCLSYIMQNNFNNHNSINRMAYLINNQIDGSLLDTEEIITIFGFASSDPLVRRLFLNFINNDINKKEKYMYYYNKGRMLRSNYIETGEK